MTIETEITEIEILISVSDNIFSAGDSNSGNISLF